MTHTSTEQPDAEKLALIYEGGCAIDKRVAAELRRQRARILELEASQAQRVPLSDAEIRDLYSEEVHWDMVAPYVIAFARSIEAAHGIKEQST